MSTIDTIRETYRQRQDLLRAEMRLNNQVEAIYRRMTGMRIDERAAYERRLARLSGNGHASTDALLGCVSPAEPSHDGAFGSLIPGHAVPLIGSDVPRSDDGLIRCDDQTYSAYVAAKDIGAAASLPLIRARDMIAADRKPLERRLERLARDLAVWPWAEALRGLGPLSLAQIVGEAGDLSNYANPGKLWKRMGLGLVDGERQRKVSGDAELAIRHAYSPSRRSVMWIVGDNLIRAANAEYGALYRERKAYELARNPEMPLIAAHKRAHRYMEKRLLRNLWKAWREASNTMDAKPMLPPAFATDRAVAAEAAG